MHVLIRWKNSYSVNNKELDQQHRRLVDIINTLNDSIVCHKTNEIIGQTISDLMDYVMVHFKYEESYFARTTYPETLKHIEEHISFCKVIEKFRNEYLAGNLVLLPEILKFLQHWFICHILESDKGYSDYINDK